MTKSEKKGQPNKTQIISSIFNPASETAPKTHLGRFFIWVIITAVVSGLLAGFVGVMLILSGSLSGMNVFESLSLDKILPERVVTINQQQSVTVTESEQLSVLSDRLAAHVVTLVNKKNLSDLKAVYLNADVSGHAFVLTSDGWLVTLRAAVTSEAEGLAAVMGKEVFAVERVVRDFATDAVFVKISAQNLKPVTLTSGRPSVNSRFVAAALSLPSGQVELDVLRGLKYQEQPVSVMSEDFSQALLVTTDHVSQYSRPVFSLTGQVIGLSRPGQLEVLPVYNLEPIITQVISGTTITRTFLGISFVSLSGQPGLPAEQRQGFGKGALVTAAPAGSPAALAGIRPGDVIVRIEAEEVNGGETLSEMLLRFQPGEAIVLEVQRAGQPLEFEAVLGRRSS